MGLFYLIDMPAMGTALGSVKMAYRRTSSSLSIVNLPIQSNLIHRHHRQGQITMSQNNLPENSTGSGSIVFEMADTDCWIRLPRVGPCNWKSFTSILRQWLLHGIRGSLKAREIRSFDLESTTSYSLVMSSVRGRRW